MVISPSVRGSSLFVKVEFQNTLAEPVWVMNWLMDWYRLLADPNAPPARHALPTRELAYVCLGNRGEAVLLNGDGPIDTGDIMPTQPRRPDGSRVEPGHTSSHTLRLPPARRTPSPNPPST